MKLCYVFLMCRKHIYVIICAKRKMWIMKAKAIRFYVKHHLINFIKFITTLKNMEGKNWQQIVPNKLFNSHSAHHQPVSTVKWTFFWPEQWKKHKSQCAFLLDFGIMDIYDVENRWSTIGYFPLIKISTCRKSCLILIAT